jgi:hypothetical protein
VTARLSAERRDPRREASRAVAPVPSARKTALRSPPFRWRGRPAYSRIALINEYRLGQRLGPGDLAADGRAGLGFTPFFSSGGGLTPDGATARDASRHGSEPPLAAGGTVDAEGRRLAQGP